MYSLKMDTLAAAFDTLQSVDASSINLPKGVDRDEFELFLRVMEAESENEINDIPLSKIIELFNTVGPYSKIMETDTYLIDSRISNAFQKLRSRIGKRRIL